MDFKTLNYTHIGRTVKYERGTNDGVSRYSRIVGTLVQINHRPDEYSIRIITSPSGSETMAWGKYGDASIEFI